MKVLAHVGSVVAQASLNNPGARVQVVGLGGGAVGVSMGARGFPATPSMAGAPGIPNPRGGSAGIRAMPQVYHAPGFSQHQQQMMMMQQQQQQQQQQLIQQQQQQILRVSCLL